jgi:MYXO-CTERM domain-containing protein
MRLLKLLVAGSLAFVSTAALPGVALARDDVDPMRRPAGWCGTPQIDPPGGCAKIGSKGPEPKRTIFLNRGGGVYSPGIETDSALNTVAAIQISTGTIPPYPGTDADWAVVLACVQQYYARWNVEVVDQEPPPSEPYLEVAVGGSQTDIQYKDNIGGVWGVASSDVFCTDVDNNGIAFAFAADHPPQASDYGRQEMCLTIVHETGHLAGLEHEVLPVDIMSYEQSATKDFQDQDSPCGEYVSGPRACCGGVTTQNSFQKLNDYLAPYDVMAPTLEVTSPADGAAVPPGFAVTATASDDHSVESVQLFVDGDLVGSDTKEPYAIETPAGIALGAHTIEVRAIDKSSNITSKMLAVMVQPACTTAAECTKGDICQGGACVGDIGASCNQSGDCASGLCLAGDGFAKFCSKICSASADCPDGFDCAVSGGGATKCLPSSGGGCRADGRSHGGAGAWALAALGLFVLARPRRRR